MSNASTSMCVAVTGLDCKDNPHPGVAVAQCLRADPNFQGRIIGLTYDPQCTGAYRNDLFDEVHLLPYSNEGQFLLKARLIELARRGVLNVLIPSLDTEIAFCSRIQDDLATAGIQTFMPSESAVKARTKMLLPHFCEKFGLDVPRTEIIVDEKQFKQMPFPTPWILKGSIVDAVPVSDKASAAAVFKELTARWGYPVLAQQAIQGEEYTCAALAGDDHELLGIVPIRKFTVSSKGKATSAVTLEDESLVAEARRVARAFQWVGPMEIEWIREASSGRMYLIEINGRFPAWIHLALGCGMNLPAALLDLIAGQSVQAFPAPPAGRITMRTTSSRVTSLDRYLDLVATGSSSAASKEMQG